MAASELEPLKHLDSCRSRWMTLLAVGALALPSLGCENTLAVKEREFLTPAGLDPDLLYAGAMADFQEAYSGGTSWGGFITIDALLTDQLFVTTTGSSITAADQRAQFPMDQAHLSDGVYTDLHQVRRAAIRAIRAMESAGLGADPRIPELRMLEAYSTLALGEGFCSGIPFSEVDEQGAFIDGAPLSTAQVFERALGFFDEASGAGPAAAIGKARTLVNLGRYSEAASAVSGVPTSFVRNIEHSANSVDQNNPIFGLQSNGRFSLSNLEGTNGLPYRDAQDPRIPWVEDPAGAFIPSLPLYLVLSYGVKEAPVRVADGIEARLIEAEADLPINGGSGTQWLNILNTLRRDVRDLMAARVPDYSSLVPGPNNPSMTLPDLVDPGNDAARVDMVFSERAFWLFLTGHRIGDLRRLMRDYGRDGESIWPVGPFHRGGEYGGDVVLPLRFEEQNNSLYDVTMCSYTTP
jgi:hypothetical protein